jgi:hypothetical protein
MDKGLYIYKTEDWLKDGIFFVQARVTWEAELGKVKR